MDAQAALALIGVGAAGGLVTAVAGGASLITFPSGPSVSPTGWSSSPAPPGRARPPQINEGTGRTFAAVLRSFLRQDSDAILVGETRDLETAQIAVRAALTGYFVLSTVHTSDCASTITRLVDMGILACLVAASLLLVAQRLARRVCDGCAEPVEIDEDVLAAHGHVPTGRGPLTVARGKGCERCNFTGMRGRIALYELMPITEPIKELIVGGAPVQELRAQAQGMTTLRQAGIARVLEGITTVDEMLRVTLA